MARPGTLATCLHLSSHFLTSSLLLKPPSVCWGLGGHSSHSFLKVTLFRVVGGDIKGQRVSLGEREPMGKK